MNRNVFAADLSAAAQPVGNASLAPARQREAASRWFYCGTAAFVLLVAITGFIPSYFAKIAHQTFASPPIYHIHAALFFSWAVLNVTQTWLVATGRTYDHRRWGLLGIALATAMTISIVLMVITAIKFADSHGFGAAQRYFQALNIFGAVKFAAFFGAAIVFVQRSDIHKRLIVVANTALLSPPLGRLLILALVPAGHRGPPPAYVMPVILVLAYSPVFAGMLHDWRLRGRPHLVYGIGLLVGLGGALLMGLVGKTAASMSVMNWLVGMFG